jgi:hypothetical protein
MPVVGLRVEDRITGDGKWSPWKAKIVLILEELELWDIVQTPMVLPPVTDPVLMGEFKKMNIKAKRIILDAVKDHIISHVSGKMFSHEM